MRGLTVFFVILFLFFQVYSQPEDFTLQLKSKIPLGDQGRLYLPKKQQALIFNKNSFEIWSIETGELLKKLPPINTKYFFKELSPNEEKFIAYDFANKEAELWDIETGKMIAVLPKQKAGIKEVVWSADSRFFLLYSYENAKELFVWNAETGKTQLIVTSKYGSYGKFSPDGKQLLTALNSVRFKQNYSVRLWDIESGKLLKEFFPSQKNRYVKAQFTPNGKYILAEQEGNLFSWDINTGEIKNVFTKNIDRIYTLTKFSPDGKFLLVHKTKFRGLTKHDESWFEIYNAETGELKIELRTQKSGKHQVETHQIIWRPDSRALVSAGEYYNNFQNYEAESWDVLTGKQKFVLSPLVAKLARGLWESGYDNFDEISFTPDSKFFITSNPDFLRIWDAETGELLRKFDVGEGRFFFTYDKKYLGKMIEKEDIIYFYELAGK